MADSGRFRTCPVEGLRHRCTREDGHEGYHWQEDSNGIAIFGYADRPLFDPAAPLPSCDTCGTTTRQHSKPCVVIGGVLNPLRVVPSADARSQP